MLWGPTEILRGGATVEQAMLIAGWVAFLAIWRMGLRQFSAVGA